MPDISRAGFSVLLTGQLVLLLNLLQRFDVRISTHFLGVILHFCVLNLLDTFTSAAF